MVQHEGGYTDYANRKKWEAQEVAIQTNAENKAGMNNSRSNDKNWKAGQKKKLKFTYQEQKDYESIEGEMAALEERIAQIDKETLGCASDFVKLNALAKEKEEAEKLLEEKMERWMYLEDLAAKIAAQ